MVGGAESVSRLYQCIRCTRETQYTVTGTGKYVCARTRRRFSVSLLRPSASIAPSLTFVVTRYNRHAPEAGDT